MDNITKNVKLILIVFLVLFLALFTYLAYFEIFTGPKIIGNQDNKRLWAKRNEVLRGNIYDRNNKPLTKSSRVNVLNQNREYAYGELFSHVIGYVDPKYGLTGLEYKYDNYLMENNQLDLIKFVKNGFKALPRVGDDLITTLDYDIQKAAFDLLGDNRGAVVAIEPSTGAILAMVSKPSFDPNNLDKIWSDLNKNKDRPLLNRAVSGLYPPGSTFKVVTALSALENIQGIENEKFNDNGKLVIGQNYSLGNYQGEVLGNIGLREAIVHSSNVVMGGIGIRLGNNTLKTTAEKFYFNNNIPADGLIIDNSIFPSYKSSEQGNIAQSAIGQSGVLSTPIQMALVASTIANDGIMMKPHLIKQIKDANGNLIKTINNESLGVKAPKADTEIIKAYMRDVVKEGTGTNARISGVVVSGKTGTAEHSESDTPHSWFIGFAPYESPKVAVAVIVEEGGTGGSNAAKIAAAVMKLALK